MLVHVVDDNAVNCEIFASIASRLASDIRVESFVDPIVGLASSQQAMPDLIVVDYMMPELDGFQYAKRIRALPGGKVVPIVMITAATDRAIRHQALELGVTDFLTKPIDKQEVRARLTNLLALRRAHTQLHDRSRWLADEVRKATEQVLHQANHDGLTALPNRAHFLAKLDEALSSARRAGGEVALLYLDLDGFKTINDSFGHCTGDALLVNVGTAIRDVLKPGEMAARLGGDEFAVLQEGVLQPDGADALAMRLTQAVRTACGDANPLSSVDVSLGIGLYPDHADTGAHLLQRADIALYRAKKEGRGRHRFFHPEMDAEQQERCALERDLGAALAENRLEVYYQPQADAVTGEIVGCEALARWTDPLRGAIPPSVFVPMAEECGLIRPLGEWILRTACAEAVTWPNGLRVGVNLSPLQVKSDLPALVSSILLETGLPPERLELEITEGLLIKEPERAIAVLGQLKALGVTIALDDFGTGYSSLSYLQTFEFDRIKIDRSFVAQLLRQPEAEAIIRAILAMTRSLCVASIAEGIETVQQLAALQREQCQEVQGYLIGRPMPATALADFIEEAKIRGVGKAA